jgi:hypothetical protein
MLQWVAWEIQVSSLHVHQAGNQLMMEWDAMIHKLLVAMSNAHKVGC